jgi:hypothetical protein
LKAYTGTIFGSAGIRTSNHPASKLINLRFGTTMEHVAYHGAVPKLTSGAWWPVQSGYCWTRAAHESERRASAR